MKKLLLFLILVFNFVLLNALICTDTKFVANSKTGEEQAIPHFFTHALIAYPEIAFQKDNGMRSSYDIDCVTVSEFKKFLIAMYNNNYCLIDISEVYCIKNDKAYKKSVSLTNGKKPFLLSFDDINYYTKKMHKGMNDKLILSNGKIATFTKYAISQINYDNEVITVLENFIAMHPDFSYNNAKGIINLTGFDGILGYRTQQKSPNINTEIVQVKPVVAKLKQLGWKFASHSYGHYKMKKISIEHFTSDTQKWINEVEPIIGKTDIYVYPYGDWEITKNGKISDKHQCLVNNGFKFFMGVGSSPFFGYLPFDKNYEQFLFMDRIPFDGFSLRNNKTTFNKYFTAEEIYDDLRFIPFKK